MALERGVPGVAESRDNRAHVAYLLALQPMQARRGFSKPELRLARGAGQAYRYSVLSARRRPAAARIWVRLLIAVRVLTVVLGLQVSGVAHAVEDAVNLVSSGHAAHEEQCPADGPCSDCPPGCPQCHCPNALRSIAPHASLPLAFLLEGSKAAAPCADVSAPLSPDLPGLFRPPQAALAVS